MLPKVRVLGKPYSSLQIVLMAMTVAAGFLLAHKGMTTHHDFRICFDNALNNNPLPQRPIYWAIWDHFFYSLAYLRFLWAGLQGVLFMLPTLILLAIPQAKFDYWRVAIFCVPILFAAIAGLDSSDSWHDCDRKGSEFGWGILFFIPAQFVFIAVIGYGGLYLSRLIDQISRKT